MIKRDRREEIKKRMLKMNYGNEEGLLRLVFDILECKSEVVKSSSNIYIYIYI